MHRFCFGTLMADIEMESFERDAVLMLTFHGCKGLEFDNVYVARTGRDPDIAPPLRTQIFSGNEINFDVDADGHPVIADAQQAELVNRLAVADRDREVYVAMTRARNRLTFLMERDADFNLDRFHSTLADFIKDVSPIEVRDGVSIYELDSSELIDRFNPEAR